MNVIQDKWFNLNLNDFDDLLKKIMIKIKLKYKKITIISLYLS